MRVKEIMSTPVVITKRNVKLNHLKDRLTRKNISAVPVLEEDGTIAGIISASDILAIHNENLTANDILTPKVHICLKNNRIEDAGKLMIKHSIHHIIIMEDGNVVGMLSALDIIKFYSKD
jgi:CBS domain-containing protein